MNSEYFLRCRVWAVAAWAITALVLIASWVLAFVQPLGRNYAGVMACTGCAMCGIAVTLQVRSFIVRVCALIRAAATSNRPEVREKGLFPVGD